AYMDSTPIVVITGQVASTAIGTDAFQECDTTGITMPVTKHNWLITDAQDIPRVVKEAFHVATTGRPGPVLIDLPKDIANAPMDWYWPESVDLPGYKPTTKGHPRMIREAAKLIGQAKKPVIYAGGGILKAHAAEALRELVDMTGIPVVTTLMARGAFPDSHELCLGMPGMHGNYTAVTSMQKCDLLIALGSRFDDRVTGKVSAFAPDAKVIHVDIDPAELNKVRRPDVPIVGDCRLVIEEINKAVRDLGGTEAQPDRSAWIDQLQAWQKQYPLHYEQPETGTTLNDACLGMVRQWQELFYEERYSEVYLSPHLPDYKMWAEAMGCEGMRVESPEEVDAAIDKANSIDDRPVVIDFRVDYREKVYPMVPAGGSNDDIILDPSQGEGGR